MKKKIKIELVIKKEKEIEGVKRYSGYVSVDGQPFRFWNLPFELVQEHFLSTAQFCLNEIGVEEKNVKPKTF